MPRRYYRRSITGHLSRIEIESPAVIGDRELVSVYLLGPAGVVVGKVVAHSALGMALGRIEAKAEDAGARPGVIPPSLHVERAAVAQEGSRVAVRRDGDLRRAEVGNR